jgi:hypothetical protein
MRSELNASASIQVVNGAAFQARSADAHLLELA